MAGKMIQVIPRTDFAFSFPTSGTQSIVLGPRAIDTTGFVSGVLVATMHKKDFTASSTAAATITAQSNFYDPADPTVNFQIAAPIATLTIAHADTAPLLYEDALSTPIGPAVQCVLNFSQGASVGACTITLSVYLVGRDA